MGKARSRTIGTAILSGNLSRDVQSIQKLLLKSCEGNDLHSEVTCVANCDLSAGTSAPLCDSLKNGLKLLQLINCY
jgi:hypothetical protein